MSRKIKESSSSNNISLDEIKAVINGRFDEFSKKLASIEERFDKTTKKIYLKLDKIEKKKKKTHTQKNLELKLVRTVMKLKI